MPIEPFTSSKTIRIFSIPLAKTLLLLSALVYERKDNLVLAASRDVAASKRDDKSPNARDQLLESAQSKLSGSEQTIWLQVFSFPFPLENVSNLSTSTTSYRPQSGDSSSPESASLARNLEDLSQVYSSQAHSIYPSSYSSSRELVPTTSLRS